MDIVIKQTSKNILTISIALLLGGLIIMNEIQVWYCEDLRRYIFSFLRKYPKKICSDCNQILVWDKKVKNYIVAKWIPLKNNNNDNYCIDCWYKYLPINSCLIT